MTVRWIGDGFWCGLVGGERSEEASALEFSEKGATCNFSLS